MIVYSHINTPIGDLLVAVHGMQLIEIAFPKKDTPPLPDPGWIKKKSLPLPVAEEIHAYFAGELTTFSIPYAPEGTDFQKKVWQAMTRIPYGETASYQDIAEMIGSPKASRAVGGAAGKNPIPLVIPCHRVIGKDGSLTGFGGGLPIKTYLLDLENRFKA